MLKNSHIVKFRISLGNKDIKEKNVWFVSPAVGVSVSPLLVMLVGFLLSSRLILQASSPGHLWFVWSSALVRPLLRQLVVLSFCVLMFGVLAGLIACVGDPVVVANV